MQHKRFNRLTALVVLTKKPFFCSPQAAPAGTKLNRYKNQCRLLTFRDKSFPCWPCNPKISVIASYNPPCYPLINDFQSLSKILRFAERNHIMELCKRSSRIMSIEFNTPCLFRSATAFLYHLFLHYISSSNRISKQLIAIFNHNQLGLGLRK